MLNKVKFAFLKGAYYLYMNQQFVRLTNQIIQLHYIDLVQIVVSPDALFSGISLATSKINLHKPQHLVPGNVASTCLFRLRSVKHEPIKGNLMDLNISVHTKLWRTTDVYVCMFLQRKNLECNTNKLHQHRLSPPLPKLN